jgi:type VI secretion system secreted protein VgrG
VANEEPLRYFLELGGRTHELKTVRGEEALSRTYRFEVTWHVDPTDPLDPDAVVGEDATLVLSQAADMRRIQGVVTRVKRMATRMGNSGAGKVTLVLEPRLATTRFRTDIRVFRDKTAPEIVAEVIGAHGIPVVQSLAASYVRRPYCVQMRESDHDFAARLLEDEGIFYIVTDDGKMLLGDLHSAYRPGPGVLFFAHDAGLFGQRDAVYHIGWAGRATAGKVSLRDFNPERPRLNMDVSAKGPTAWGPEWYDYPGEYEVPAQGQIKANLRAEALVCQKRRLAGKSTCPTLATGGLFVLADAPPGIDDGQYVIAKLVHDWDRLNTAFSVQFEALTGKTVYRPPLETYVPVLPNPLTGFVTGPPGADIHTDPWGRVKVHFPWDRLQPKDDNCSHWIPVLQDNTGRSSAMPRIGWEVLCQYLEGDPDRPVILGRMFNAADPFPEDLPIRKTRIALQSLTSPRADDGRTGYNLIRFEDLAGEQAIDLHAEKDQNVVVANNQDENVGAAQQRTVKGDEKVSIGGDETIDVTVDSVNKVNANQTTKIGGDRTANVTGPHTDNVEKDHTLEIGGNHMRKMHVDDNLAVAKDLTEIISGLVYEQAGKTITLAGGKTSELVVAGSIIEVAKMSKTEGTDENREEEVTGDLFIATEEKQGSRTEVKRETTVTGNYTVLAMKEILFAGLEKLKIEATDITLLSPDITLKVEDTELHMKNGTIDMYAPKKIVIDTQQANDLAADESAQN